MTEEMLERAIEIEGLIRILRDGNPLPETFALLKRKTGELADMAAGLVPTQHEAAEFIPEYALKGEEKVDLRMEEAEKEEEAIINKDEEKKIEDDTRKRDKDNEDVGINEDKRDEEDDDILLNDIILSVNDDDDETADADNDNYTQNAETTDYSDGTYTGVKVKSEIKAERNLKSAFSLNDRFLYSRELFNGNMKTFDSTLKSLEAAADFEMVEDYFYNELDWNREDPTVESFMEKIASRF